MGRVLIFVLIAIGAGLYFPRSRDVILNVTEPVMAPVLRWTTRQELARIAEDLEIVQGSGGNLPTGRGEFDTWLVRRYPQIDGRTDAWGGLYVLRAQRDAFVVASSGPDGVHGNDDDLIESRRLAPTPRGR